MQKNKWEYVVLQDKKNNGTIVRCEGRHQYRYDNGRKTWIRSGILMEYFCDESPLFELYEEITEDEAMKLIKAM